MEQVRALESEYLRLVRPKVVREGRQGKITFDPALPKVDISREVSKRR